jgi:hypothetical protein
MWAIARVSKSDEIYAADCLTEMGCEVYCPIIRWKPKPSRRNKNPEEQKTAILPNYIFVAYESIRDLEAIIRERARLRFHYFLSEGDRMATLPDEALDGLRELEAIRHAPERTGMPFGEGQQVKGKVGTLVSGMVGRVTFAIPGYATVDGGSFTKPMTISIEHLEAI